MIDMALLSEYIVAVSDRVARAPQQPPGEREAELYRLLVESQTR